MNVDAIRQKSMASTGVDCPVCHRAIGWNEMGIKAHVNVHVMKKDIPAEDSLAVRMRMYGPDKVPAMTAEAKRCLRRAYEMISRADARFLMGDLIREINKRGGEIERSVGVRKLDRAIKYLYETEKD